MQPCPLYPVACPRSLILYVLYARVVVVCVRAYACAGEGASRRAIALEMAAKPAADPADTSSEADAAWRAGLRQGRLLDAFGVIKQWFQAIVLAEGINDGVEVLKVR